MIGTEGVSVKALFTFAALNFKPQYFENIPACSNIVLVCYKSMFWCICNRIVLWFCWMLCSCQLLKKPLLTIYDDVAFVSCLNLSLSLYVCVCVTLPPSLSHTHTFWLCKALQLILFAVVQNSLLYKVTKVKTVIKVLIYNYDALLEAWKTFYSRLLCFEPEKQFIPGY